MGGLALHGSTQVAVRGVGFLAIWTPVAVCWRAVLRVGFRRWDVLLGTSAVTVYSTTITSIGLTLTTSVSALSFTPAAIVLLAFYPLMMAALAVLVHSRARGLASSVWLDAVVGSLGAAAVLAIMLGPVWGSALSGMSPILVALRVAHPVFDLILVAAIAGILASGSMSAGGRWHLLFAGLMLFTAADVIYALQEADGSYVTGSPLDGWWVIGLVMIALWVDGAQRHIDSRQHDSSSGTSATALVVATGATLAGMGVLVAGTWAHLPVLAVVLAGATLLAAVARAQLAYRQLARMADVRHQAATTDDLTGLPNRRALYAVGLARLVERQGRRQALLMLDLDKFKEVNDSLGHRAGDQLLTQVASRLREHLRAGDVLARLGGTSSRSCLRMPPRTRPPTLLSSCVRQWTSRSPWRTSACTSASAWESPSSPMTDPT